MLISKARAGEVNMVQEGGMTLFEVVGDRIFPSHGETHRWGFRGQGGGGRIGVKGG